MLRSITKAVLLSTAVLTATMSQQAQAGCHSHSAPRVTNTRVVTYVSQHVTKVNHVKVSRTELPSGSTITMFANFLGNAPGFVLVKIDEVSLSCKVMEWKPNRVTLELPQLGLKDPQAATLSIVLPDGRVVQQFSVDLVPPQRIVVHQKTIQAGIQVSLPSAPQIEDSGLLLTR